MDIHLELMKSFPHSSIKQKLINPPHLLTNLRHILPSPKIRFELTCHRQRLRPNLFLHIPPLELAQEFLPGAPHALIDFVLERLDDRRGVHAVGLRVDQSVTGCFDGFVAEDVFAVVVYGVEARGAAAFEVSATFVVVVA